MKKILSLLLLLLLSTLATNAFAIPVTLQLTKDELSSGRAVLSGDVTDTYALLPPNTIFATFTEIGTHWHVTASILKILNPQIGLFYKLQVDGRHISNPPPHPGEATPGLLLETEHFNLSGVPNGAVDPQDITDQLIHPGSESHYDAMTTHLDDLRPNHPSFLTLFNNQISARIDLVHTPEPATVVLLSAGFLGMAGLRKRLS